MKLLLDENLSPRLLRRIQGLFPGSAHVRDVGLEAALDSAVWSYAAGHEFVILSKDSDFHQMSALFGHPPKVIWIRRGNCSTNEVAHILESYLEAIRQLDFDTDTGLLVLS